MAIPDKTDKFEEPERSKHELRVRSKLRFYHRLKPILLLLILLAIMGWGLWRIVPVFMAGEQLENKDLISHCLLLEFVAMIAIAYAVVPNINLFRKTIPSFTGRHAIQSVLPISETDKRQKALKIWKIINERREMSHKAITELAQDPTLKSLIIEFENANPYENEVSIEEELGIKK